ncbi:glycosyl transferase family 2 [Shewanella halifaxensis HAW-EB4]|uniref:Glycosyl transferase family 2 n=1 Tax=Shewanella halifaxensis (strain HAW-EB4) TaxID=458817 RepID=B0TN88_SHEHH|nr:glycosyltransferase [Shewanella halifaxensis]ABZ76074.1 glycosyl transferase family 2 [Shewanella halifaxensis HAW-EB4]
MTANLSHKKVVTVKVSVVMPIYNVEAFVADAINSVLAQSFDDFELILINDCSQDNSLSICKQFTDPRVRIIEHQQNQGLAAARNTGIRHALGQYVAFIDSDDMWHSEKLQQHVSHLDNAPEVGISFSRSLFMNYQGQKINVYQMPQLTNIKAKDLLCRNPVGNGSAPVIRHETLSDIQYQSPSKGLASSKSQALNKSNAHNCYFDENFRQSEDIECWLRIVTTTHWKIEGIPAPLTFYRLNDQGLSSDLNKQYASWEKMICKAKGYAPELLAQHENKARAYQLRYIARQAIRNKDGKEAVKYLHLALKTAPSIIQAETGRTLATMSAAYLLKLLPLNLYRVCEDLAQRILGRIQASKINRDGVDPTLLK